MHIGGIIKTRRKELNLTQAELAKKLNVSRATVANWEQERNYPDSQMIVKIAEELGISLDALINPIRYEERILSKKEKNKKIRKRIAICSLITLIISFSFIVYKTNEYKGIQSAEQFKNIEVKNNTINIELDLPWYRSVVGYDMYSNKDDKNATNVEIYTKISFNDNKNSIKVDFLNWLGETEIKKVHFVNEGNIIKSVKIN